MKTVHEASQISGVSVRTLHHYDAIGLLRPTAGTEAGYRLYDDTALARPSPPTVPRHKTSCAVLRTTITGKSQSA